MDPDKLLEEYATDVSLEPEDRPTEKELLAAEHDTSPHWFWSLVATTPNATVWKHIPVEGAPQTKLVRARALQSGDSGIRVVTRPASGADSIWRGGVNDNSSVRHALPERVLTRADLDVAIEAGLCRHFGSESRHRQSKGLSGGGAVQQESGYLTVDQVADLVHHTSGTVRSWIKQGELKASRLGPKGKGRIYAIAVSDLRAFLHQRRVNPVIRDIEEQADEMIQTLDRHGGK